MTPAEEEDIQRVAREQAEKDLELLAKLQARKAEAKDLTVNEEQAEFEEPVRVPMNRAQRREQVKLYARVLAETERQTPVVNPTIIPKSKRRRKGRGNVRLNNARG